MHFFAVGANTSHIRPLWRVWLPLFVLFFSLYALTCQRGVAWQDSGNHQHRMFAGEPLSEFGIAVSHPLYIMAGGLVSRIPLGDPALRINLLSALGMAIAVANLGCVSTLLTGRA